MCIRDRHSHLPRDPRHPRRSLAAGRLGVEAPLTGKHEVRADYLLAEAHDLRNELDPARDTGPAERDKPRAETAGGARAGGLELSLIHISEPTRLGMISYAVFCLKKKKKKKKK